MAMSDEQDKQLEELIKTKLREQYNRGLQIGVLTISKVILDKLDDSSKPLMERIKDIKKFCSIPWNQQKKNEQALKEAVAKMEQITENPAHSEGNSSENSVENGEN